jgi:N,N'-diacetyllegionaminate synthase
MNISSLPVLVCELANSHGGRLDVLERLIDAFANLDYPRKGIKFQVFSADTIALKDYSWYDVYQQLEIPPEQWRHLIKRASKIGDTFIDVFDSYSVEILEQNHGLIAGIKLQASVLENDEVLSKLCKLNLSQKTLVLNVSGLELSEIQRILNRFHDLTSNIVLQTGFQSYPTAIEDTAIQKVAILRAAFPEFTLGIADHADGASDFAEMAPLYAYLLGCDYIEKHFCIDRASAPYDGYSALEIKQMQRLGVRLHELNAACKGPFVSQNERDYLASTVQIPVLGSAVSAGTRIKPADLIFRRTVQSGISWQEIDKLQRQRFVIKKNKSIHQSLCHEDFRSARVAVIVAARMKSSRLKKKALLPIAGRASVERCLDQCFAIKGADEVILATSVLDEDAILSNYLCEQKAKFWAGDPDDVIDRYLGACDTYKVDVVVRVTADCPLISPEIMDFLLESHFETGADYTAAANAAVGTVGEVINTSALREVIARLGSAEHSEYMTWYFKNNPDVFNLNIVDLPPEYVRDYRLTLDHSEDLELFELIFKELLPGKSSYSLDEVFAVFDNNPNIQSINSHIPLKYKTDKKFIAKLNKKTRIS